MGNKIFVATTQMVFIIIASYLIGSVYGAKIGVSIGLLAWALTPQTN